MRGLQNSLVFFFLGLQVGHSSEFQTHKINQLSLCTTYNFVGTFDKTAKSHLTFQTWSIDGLPIEVTVKSKKRLTKNILSLNKNFIKTQILVTKINSLRNYTGELIELTPFPQRLTASTPTIFKALKLETRHCN